MSLAPLTHPVHALAIAEVFQTYTTRAEGLTKTEAQDRLRLHGPNIIQESKPPPLYRKLLANFTHLMAILLWVGGALSFIAGIPQLGVAVWLVVIINLATLPLSEQNNLEETTCTLPVARPF